MSGTLREGVKFVDADSSKMVTTSWSDCGDMTFYIGNYVKEAVKVKTQITYLIFMLTKLKAK